MPRRRPSFTLGVEEEYLLVDRDSRDVVSDPPRELFEACKRAAGESLVEPELLRSQIEINTPVCENIGELRHELTRLRRLVADTAAEFGLAPIAASSHPFGHWQSQRPTDKERYQMLSRKMQSLARRMLIGGMHVHVAIEDQELRIELLNQFTYFLPLLLALSTSSPFWDGEDSGLMSYRLTVWDGFPRTGLPERYSSHAEFERHVRILQKAGVIEDATLIWWDLRPSARYPTLESRITDVCTRFDDAVGLAALIQTILHRLYRLAETNMAWQVYPRFLVDQNRWLAMRYGCDRGLIDFGTGELTPVQQWLDQILGLVSEDADMLGTREALEHVRGIPARGTSAHRQLATYRAALEDHGPQAALQAVVDELIDVTVEGL